MANGKSQQRFPSRRREVLKKISRVSFNGSTTVAHKVLHTASDPVTLARIIGNFSVQMQAAADTDTTFAVLLQVAPRGTTLYNPGTGESLDIDIEDEHIAAWMIPASAAAEGQVNLFIPVDMNTKRKLRPGDQLVLSVVSSVNGAGLFKAYLTTIFLQ
jgi:hypothetical protein